MARESAGTSSSGSSSPRVDLTGVCVIGDHGACAPSAAMKISVGGFGCVCPCHAESADDYDWGTRRDDRD